MCWYSYNTSGAKVAKNDIKVWKVVKKVLAMNMMHAPENYDELSTVISSYYYSKILFGHIGEDGHPVVEDPEKIYESDLFIGGDSHMKFCMCAFHSYAEGLLKNMGKGKGYVFITGENWDDPYKQHFYQVNNNDVYIMHCVIPAGAEYAVNESGEYVSNKLKVISFEEL